MSKYYAIIDTTNNSISKGQCPCSGTNIICLEVIQEVYDNIEKYIYVNGELMIDPDYDKKQQQKEDERIAKLTMTALDFITFLRSCGIQLESIRKFLDNNLELDTQLKYCQSVYCGIAESVMPIEVDGITITKDMVRQAFINKSKESN